MRKLTSRLVIFLYSQLIFAGFAALAISCQAEQTPAPQLTQSTPAAATSAPTTTTQTQSSTATLSGTALYDKYCEKCHGALEESQVAGATASGITNAIVTVSQMKTLQTLKVSEVNAVGAVLSKLSQPTATPAPAAGDDDDDGGDDDDDEAEDD